MERLWRRPGRAAVFGSRPNHARKRQRSQACLDLPHGRHSEEVRIRADPAQSRQCHLWMYDPQVPAAWVPYTAACRGVAFYSNPNATAGQACAERIIEGTLDMRLI